MKKKRSRFQRTKTRRSLRKQRRLVAEPLEARWLLTTTIDRMARLAMRLQELADTPNASIEDTLLELENLEPETREKLEKIQNGVSSSPVSSFTFSTIIN